MANLEFYKLGTNPELEAVRTQQLYFDYGVDEFVRDEFEATVNAYTSLSLPDLTQRLGSRYMGDKPLAYGVLPIYHDTDIGMVIWGEKEFIDIETRQEISGINVSAWLLRQYRGIGLGKQVIKYATEEALTLSKTTGKQIWTSIKPDNLASRRSCEHAGFIELGLQPDKPDRLLYILKPS